MKPTERTTPDATEIFIDRIIPRKAFWGKYHEVVFEFERNAKGLERVVDPPKNIIMFFGIGGIGKSKLISKFESELTERIENPLFITYNFACKHSPLPQDVLEDMREMLFNKYRFKFPTYDFAILALAQKRGKNMDKKTINNLIERNPYLSAAISFLGAAPISGASLASTMLKLTDKVYVAAKTGYQGWLKKRNAEIQNIVTLDPNRIEQNLPLYFARDLSDHLEHNSKNNSNPLVIFLDTYENLVN